ncbi:MAG: hypothetical protein O2894_08805 [Planctomycetota bacterium]|nr:hypothetical protein [Planctomycetota bacterium]
MTIHQRPPPEGYDDALAESLSRLASTRAGADFLAWRFESTPQATAPHPVYALGRDELADGATLEDARLVSWRALVQVDETQVHAVEHRLAEEGGTPQLLSVSKGPFGLATMEAVAAAERYESDGDHELRLLKIPALQFVAVWLRGPPDALVPLADHPAGLAAHEPVAPEEALGLLRAHAEALRRRERASESDETC